MKAIAYSVKPFEKEFLAKANQKKHDITLISNSLTFDTSSYAEGKKAVIVFTNDDVSGTVIDKLAGYGIKYIQTRSVGTDHIDKHAAAKYGIKIANVPSYSPLAIAEHAVALAFALNRKLSKSDQFNSLFDFKNDEFIGFNFFGKTVGIVGLGHIGREVAKIYHGIGCKIIGCDPNYTGNITYLKKVSFDELLASADIISLHVPLNDTTRDLIYHDSLSKMKNGVMLINASRGAVMNTRDVLSALEKRKIGYLGLDVYEYGRGLFGEYEENNFFEDPLLKNLWMEPNVLITPHQAYLTKEALQEIADQTIKNLDLWQRKKCVGKACACADACSLK